MKRKTLSISALILTVTLTGSLILTTQNTWAADGTVQNSSDSVTASTDSPNPASSDSTSKEPEQAPANHSALKLSLEDALGMIEKQNSDLKLLDSKISIYDKQNQQAIARRDMKSTVVDEDSNKERNLNFKRTQWNLDNIKHDRDNKLKDLQVDITNQYESILALEEQAQNLKNQQANLDTVIDNVNLQIKLGLQVPSALYDYNAQKAKLEAGQTAVQKSINSAMNMLKQDLGIDLNREVTLTSKLGEYAKFDDSDVDNRIAYAIENNYDIQKIKQDLEISQIEYDIDFRYDDNITADTIQLSMEDKKATLANLAVTKEVDLRTAYNSIKTIEATIEADQLTLEADKINIDLMQKKIDAGQSSTLEMIPLDNKQLSDQYTLRQDVIAYRTAVANFNNRLDQDKNDSK